MSSPFAARRPQQGCHEPCCSGFYRLERIPPNLPGPNLTGPIHRIFSPAGFQSQLNYAALVPSLRLATHFIDASLPFFWHILTANKIFLGTDTTGNDSYELQTPITIFSPQDLQKTRDALDYYSDCMMFDLKPPIPGESTAGSVTNIGRLMPDGYTRWMVISLDSGLYEDAVKILNGTLTDVVLVHWTLFFLAVNLVHGVVHAFTTTVMHLERYPPKDMTDLYFPNGVLAEEGFEWEFYTFGGIVSAQPPVIPNGFESHFLYGRNFTPYAVYSNDGRPDVTSSMTGMISLVDWPNFALLATYRSTGEPLGCRGLLPAAHTRWNIPFSDIYRFLQHGFWAQRAPGSLKFARRTGHRFISSQQQGSEGEELQLSTVNSAGFVDVTTGVYPPFRVHYNPPKRRDRSSSRAQYSASLPGCRVLAASTTLGRTFGKAGTLRLGP